MATDNEELQAIAREVRKFAESELAPHAVEWDRTKHFPVDVLRRAGDLGLGGICVGEDVGGSGLGRLDAVTIFEELARGDTTIAAYVSIHNMVTAMIDQAGTGEQRRRWVPTLAGMEGLGSYCLTEPDAGSDAGALRTTARRDGDGYVLDGVKQFISGAGASSVYVVMARTGVPGPRGITAFIVPGDAAGLSFGANEHKMGWHAQPTRQVILDGVRVPAEQRLGAEGDGFGIAMRGLNGGRLNIAACSLGGAQWALEQAIRHLQTRTAFGAPLITQQALLFRLADMETELQASRCLLHHAAKALDEGAADAVKLCAMAKQFVTDAAFTVANTALQLHGGYGYLSEYGIEKVVRDLRVHQILEGTNEIMRMIVGRALVEEAA
ncbi:acyl-CoA dehydrogenase family protein [Kribbella sp. CA-293567]|uniref:acyl-CoA dehydrogenase family protein n=1 Tax=Kribbella sp. CA-293567 TaxID=3002436 RepID=UPI0022DD3B64|nr:acyl-CoA dehydrogenase family protein [Kribbella sp. CA-293567]WBQ07954.1 acyl-CoA dehydrogenase family protein [Kribbella sp. CA-293567]